MADHSYLLCKVLGWKSNSPDSWASVSHAQEVLNIDVSWKKPSLQIEPIWAPHDCVGRKRIFPWRAFPRRLLLWAVGDECSANATSCQVLPGVPGPVPQHRQEQRWALGSSLGTGWGQAGSWAHGKARLSETHGRAGLWGAGARTCRGCEAGKGCRTPVQAVKRLLPCQLVHVGHGAGGAKV